jgi:hypothetical protein
MMQWKPYKSNFKHSSKFCEVFLHFNFGVCAYVNSWLVAMEGTWISNPHVHMWSAHCPMNLPNPPKEEDLKDVCQIWTPRGQHQSYRHQLSLSIVEFAHICKFVCAHIVETMVINMRLTTYQPCKDINMDLGLTPPTIPLLQYNQSGSISINMPIEYTPTLVILPMYLKIDI